MREARTAHQWNDTTVPTGRDLEIWDAQLARALDGDGGGAYNPAKPIKISGQGVTLNAVPVWRTPKTRTLRQSLLDYPGCNSNGFEWAVDDTSGGLTAVTATSAIHLPLRLHNSARLANVRVYFKIPKLKASLPPGQYPRIAVARTNPTVASGIAYLNTVGGGFKSWTDLYGTPATVADYTKGGAVQFMDYLCNIANDPIDLATYHYTLIVQDDNAPGPFFNTYLGAELSIENIVDNRVP